MFIIYAPFENEIVDVGDIIPTAELMQPNYTNFLVLTAALFAYIHLGRLTIRSLQELLSSVYNWWQRGQISYRLQNVEIVDDW